MVSAVLFYKKLQRDLEESGFVTNPYNIFVVNRVINGTLHTVVWYFDDMKSSHINLNVNDEFLEWFRVKFAKDENGKLKYT